MSSTIKFSSIEKKADKYQHRNHNFFESQNEKSENSRISQEHKIKHTQKKEHSKKIKSFTSIQPLKEKPAEKKIEPKNADDDFLSIIASRLCLLDNEISQPLELSLLNKKVNK